MSDEQRAIYFEHVAIGSYHKCTAIDAVTGVEISVSGPLHANPRDLEKLATARLQRKLEEQGGSS